MVYGYTLLAFGTRGYANTPYETALGTQVVKEKVGIDEELLKQIAKETGGQYFRATDNAELQNIYSSIDKLEKSKVESTTFRKRTEKFQPWVLAALLLAFLLWFCSTHCFENFLNLNFLI